MTTYVIAWIACACITGAIAGGFAYAHTDNEYKRHDLLITTVFATVLFWPAVVAATVAVALGLHLKRRRALAAARARELAAVEDDVRRMLSGGTP